MTAYVIVYNSHEKTVASPIRTSPAIVTRKAARP